MTDVVSERMAGDGRERQSVVDVDVHEMLTSIKDLVPYLDEPWRSRVAVNDGFKGPPGNPYAFPQAAGVATADAVTDDGNVLLCPWHGFDSTSRPAATLACREGPTSSSRPTGWRSRTARWSSIYFDAIPNDLRDAALVDGCTGAMAFWRVMLPLAAPGVAAVTILVAVLTWNDFLMALSLTLTPNAQTVTVGIANFMQNFSVQFGELTAASAVATVPLVILAALAHRYIVAGLTGGALKE